MADAQNDSLFNHSNQTNQKLLDFLLYKSIMQFYSAF